MQSGLLGGNRKKTLELLKLKTKHMSNRNETFKLETHFLPTVAAVVGDICLNQTSFLLPAFLNIVCQEENTKQTLKGQSQLSISLELR